MIQTQIGGQTATLRGYRWHCSDVGVQEMLNSTVELCCPPSSDPHPEGTLARDTMEMLGGEVISDRGPSGPSGLMLTETQSAEPDAATDLPYTDVTEVGRTSQSALWRCLELGLWDDETPLSDLTRAMLLDELDKEQVQRADAKTPLSGGKWLTIKGNHVYIKGGKILAGHLPFAADMAGLDESGHKALQDAHAKGQIDTDEHLYNTVQHAAEATEKDPAKSHADAVKEGVEKHGQAETTPPKPQSTSKSTKIWKPKVGYVNIASHGHELTPEHVADWAQHFEFPPKATAALMDAVNDGTIKDDHHLAQVMSDATEIKNFTGKTHHQGIQHSLNGDDIKQVIDEGKAAKAAAAKAKKEAAKKAAEAQNAPQVTPDAPASGVDETGVKTPDVASITPVAASTSMPNLTAKEAYDEIVGAQGMNGIGSGFSDTWENAVKDGKITEDNAQAMLEQSVKNAKDTGTQLVWDYHLEQALSDAGAPNDPNALSEAMKGNQNAKKDGALQSLSAPDVNAYMKSKHGLSDGTSITFEDAWKAGVNKGDITAGNAEAVLKSVADKAKSDSTAIALEAHLKEAIAENAVSSGAATQPSSPVPPLDTQEQLHAFAHSQGLPDGMTSNALKKLDAHTPLEPHELHAVMQEAANTANSEGKTQINTGHIAKALWKHDKGQLGAPTSGANDPDLLNADKAVLHLDKQHGNGALPSFKTSWQAKVKDGTITPQNAAAILAEVPSAAKGSYFVDHEELDAAIQKVKDAGTPATVSPTTTTNAASTSSPTPTATPPVATPDTSAQLAAARQAVDAYEKQPHSVTVQGHKMDVDPAKPVIASDVDEMEKAGVKFTANGKAAVLEAIKNGDIASHGQLAETLALAQASVKAHGHNQLSKGAFDWAKGQGGMQEAIEKAHAGSTEQSKVVAHLEPHTFQSKAAMVDAAKTAHADKQKADWQAGDGDYHTAKHLADETKKVKGFNDGGMYETLSGIKNYVKTLPASKADVAHNEHLANKIYQALGISAPDSKVIQHDGKTKYVSKIIENNGDLKAHVDANGGKFTPEVANEILKGFATDVLSQNWDVLGNGDKPLSNVVIGHDGAVHRIDNGGSLLFKGTGHLKPQLHLDHLDEWEGFARPEINVNYAKVFQAAGIQSPEQISGIGKQIRDVIKLRDAHGGWEGFIKQAAPDMAPAMQKKTAAVLEHRTQLLEQKLAGMVQPGDNSIVGERTFAHGSSNEDLVMQHQQANAPAISKAAKAAISHFKGSGYGALNRALLGKQEMSASNKAHVKALDEMFQQPGMTIGHDIALSRKITVDADEQKLLQQLQPGTVLAHTPCFQSTTVNSNIWSGNTHFCILAPKETPGVACKNHTGTNSGEQEILLPRGISYRVISVSKKGDPDPANTPAGWNWHGDTRVVLEPIIPGVNDVESPTPDTHQISQQEIKADMDNLVQSGKKLPVAAPNLSDLPQPSLQALPTYNEPVAPATKAKKPKKASSVGKTTV